MPFVHRIWLFLGQRPKVSLWLSIGVIVLASLVVRHGRPLDVAFGQFALGEEQILATRQVQSVFLPIGYSSFYGYIELLARPLGPAGADKVFFVAQVAVLVLVLLFARAILRRYTSAAFATTAALLIALEPALIYNVNRLSDANITLALLFGFLACLLRLRRERTFRDAVLCGGMLAAAVLVRPNFVLLAILLLWVVRRDVVGPSLGLVTAAVLAGFCAYLAVTAAVHGRPFLPQNGPYNLYAGYNPRTEQALLTAVNGEVSLISAMRDLGYHATLNWLRQSDVPGVDDVRDLRYIPEYNAQSKLFIRQHPGLSAWLLVVKFYTFMRPIHENVDHSSGGFNLFREALKTITLLVVFIWIGLLAYSGVRHLALAQPVFLWAAALYVLPFVLINADPRFRTTLEGLVCVDLARMLYLLRAKRSGADQTSFRPVS